MKDRRQIFNVGAAANGANTAVADLGDFISAVIYTTAAGALTGTVQFSHDSTTWFNSATTITHGGAGSLATVVSLVGNYVRVANGGANDIDACLIEGIKS